MSALKKTVLTFLVVGAATTLFFVLRATDSDNIAMATGPRHIDSLKLLTSEQYENSIHHIFGPGIKVDGKLVIRPERHEGLQAAGASHITLSSVGFEVGDVLARRIAGQVVSERFRAELLPCQPTVVDQPDDQCASEFLAAVGRLLYRRPLSDEELQRQLTVARLAATESGDFYAGLEKSLAHMLVSPNFLFRVERAEPDPSDSDAYRLTAYAKASRLSFLLWNSTPDGPLLDAAERGELHTAEGLQRQVERLLSSPRLEAGLRAFFSDILAFDQFDILTKDLNLFPKFGNQVAKDIREQTLRTLADHLLSRAGDYRDLFTTRQTFLTPSLAALLRVPLMQRVSNARPDRWLPYEYPAGDPRAGLVSQPAFTVLHAYPGRTSPTLRGKALREHLLCQEVPEPPGDVDFTLVRDTSNPDYKTMRQRLGAHATVPTCAGCHKITDPIGLALETFDPVGVYRGTENGAPIDTSGEIDGAAFADAAGLGQALRNNPSVVSCLVNRVYAYGVGREVAAGERKWLKALREDFAKAGYQWRPLLRQIATSDVFYRGSEPQDNPQEVAQSAVPAETSLAVN